MNPLMVLPYLMMSAGFNGRMWNGPALRDVPTQRGGRKTFKMNRRKELALSAKRKAKR